MSTDLATRTPLDDLDPRQRLAFAYYTNPMYGRTFGNKARSATAAGYAANSSKVFSTDVMRRAVHWHMQQRDHEVADVAKLLGRFSLDAAQALVKQLGILDGMEPKPMPEGLLDRPGQPIIGHDKDGNEKLLGIDTSHLTQAKEISGHNRAYAAMVKEQREALKLLLAYHLGTPEQRVKISQKEKGDTLDLGRLNDEELRGMLVSIRDMLDHKHETPPPRTEDGVEIVEGVVLDEQEQEVEGDAGGEEPPKLPF